MSVSLICFDPRDLGQSADDPTTWKETGSPALISANLQPSWIKELPGFWEQTKQLADLCDARVETAYARVRIDVSTVPEPENTETLPRIISQGNDR